MQTVQVGEFKTSYEKIGKGPILVLLHGWANTWEAWLPLIPLLSDRFTLILPDLPGFGSSQGPEFGWSTNEYAVWLAAFLKKILLVYPNRHLFLAGHSFGGKIASLYEAEHLSPHIDKLILIDASGIPGKLTPKQQTLRQLSRTLPPQIKKQLREKTKEKFYKVFGAETDYLYANRAQQNTLTKILSEDLTSKLKAIETPTLLIWGSGKKFPPLAHGQIFHHLIHGSQLKVYNSGHFPHHEFPSEVGRTMIEFLESKLPVIKLDATSKHINTKIATKHRQSLGTKLAILQQSEYEYPKLKSWLSSQTSTLQIEPKEWTVKIKTIRELTNLFGPFFGEDITIYFWNSLISFPQKLYFAYVIAKAKNKLSRLQAKGLKVVAIAGSYAKTSTKDIANHVISKDKVTLKTPGNINVLIGIARVVLKDLTPAHHVFLVELGEYNPGDIVRFVRFLRPAFKILTPIGLAHLERFDSVSALQKEFASFLQGNTNAITVIHEDNRLILQEFGMPSQNIHWYGPSQISQVEISRSGTEFNLTLDTQYHAYIPLLGAHNAVNVLPALILAQNLGIAPTAAINRLRTLAPTHARFESSLLEHNILIINNGYNSNPGTAVQSLATLKALPGSQKIVITPGFVEMGSSQAMANQVFGKELALICDYVGVVEGANETALLAGLTEAHFPSTQIVIGKDENQVMAKLQTKILPNAIILFENSLTEIYKK